MENNAEDHDPAEGAEEHAQEETQAAPEMQPEETVHTDKGAEPALPAEEAGEVAAGGSSEAELESADAVKEEAVSADVEAIGATEPEPQNAPALEGETEHGPDAESQAERSIPAEAENTADADFEADAEIAAEAAPGADGEPVEQNGADAAADGDAEIPENQEWSGAEEEEQSRLVIPEEEPEESPPAEQEVALEEIDSQTAVAGTDGEISATETEPLFAEEEESPAAVTTLEYLEPVRKEGEEEDATPRFSSVGEAKAVLEGFLFTTNEPLSVNRLSKLCGNLHPKTVRGLLLELQMDYDGRPGGLQVVEVAGGFQMATRPHIAEWMFRLHKHRRKSPLSPATLETLAIIAYKQPVTKGEVEAIRGVESGGTFRTLQDLGLVDVGGRREVPGRPQLYVTTPHFLKAFGLNSLADLPSISELRHRFADEQRLKASTMAPTQAADTAEETADETARRPKGTLPPLDVPPSAAAEELDEQSVEATHEAVSDESGTAGRREEGEESHGSKDETLANVEDIHRSGEDSEEHIGEGEADVVSPFSHEEVEAARRKAQDDEESAGDEQEQVKLGEEDEEFEPDEGDEEDEDYADLTDEDGSEFEPAGEAPLNPEDEIPPPHNTPIGRVPRPPRKGGWGVGRPLFGDEDEE